MVRGRCQLAMPWRRKSLSQHSLDSQMAHLDPEYNPGHVLASNLELCQNVGEQTCSQQLSETEVKIEDAKEEECRRRNTDDMLRRRAEERQGIGNRRRYDEEEDELPDPYCQLEVMFNSWLRLVAFLSP